MLGLCLIPLAAGAASFETSYIVEGVTTQESVCRSAKWRALGQVRRNCNLGSEVDLADWFVVDGCGNFPTPKKRVFGAHRESMCGCDCERFKLGSIPMSQAYGTRCTVRWQCPVIPEPEPAPAPAAEPPTARAGPEGRDGGHCRRACESVRFNVATCNSGKNPADHTAQYRLDSAANNELVSCVRKCREQPQALQPWFTTSFAVLAMQASREPSQDVHEDFGRLYAEEGRLQGAHSGVFSRCAGRLLLMAERHMERGEHGAALPSLGAIQGLRNQHELELPASYHLVYARAAFRSTQSGSTTPSVRQPATS